MAVEVRKPPNVVPILFGNVSYYSPEDLAKLSPYRGSHWRRLVRLGRIKGAIRVYGRIAIPVDEAQRLLPRDHAERILALHRVQP